MTSLLFSKNGSVAGCGVRYLEQFVALIQLPDQVSNMMDLVIMPEFGGPAGLTFFWREVHFKFRQK